MIFVLFLTQTGSFVEFTAGSWWWRHSISQCSCEDLLSQWEVKVELQDRMFLAKICYCGTIVSDFPSSLLLRRALRPAQLLFNLLGLVWFSFFSSIMPQWKHSRFILWADWSILFCYWPLWSWRNTDILYFLSSAVAKAVHVIELLKHRMTKGWGSCKNTGS